MAAMVFTPAQAGMTIVIVRHGEKPPQGLGQLTCQGLNRAMALAPLLLQRYGTPVALYATNPAQPKFDNGVAYAYIRPLATIEPLAIRIGMPVTLQWGMTETDALANQILTIATGTQIVAWEHHWAETLARQLLTRLGGDPAEVPQWGGTDFDSVFVIRAESSKGDYRQVRFSHEQQGLNGLSESCDYLQGRR